MSAKNQVLILAERIAKKLVAEQTTARLALAFDAAILAAHEVFGMGPGRAAAFRDAYMDAMEELAGMFIDDADKKTGNGDRDLTFAKSKRDEAIRKIVGDELFVPFDRDYGSAYIDELRRIRIMGGRDGDSKTT